MYYNFAITVPAGTAQASPKTETLELTKGIIHRVEVEFHAGCKGYVSCRLKHHLHQLYPTNPQGVFSTDNYAIPIDDYFELKAEPYSLKFEGWSPNATYDHEIIIRVGVLSDKTSLLLLHTLQGMVKFLKVVGIKV